MRLNAGHFVLTSNSRAAKWLRSGYRTVSEFTLPAPSIVVRPLRWLLIGLRSAYYFVLRVFVCEPFFKAHCTRYGSRVRTGPHIHWIQGQGRLLVGNDVLVDGKCSIFFARRSRELPELSIGDGTTIGHECAISVAERVVIGKRCLIASRVWIADTPGHPSDPVRRLARQPPDAAQVKPVTIQDNVWLGLGSVILPGVTVGENSIVGPHSVVTKSIPANRVAMGNPATVVSFLTKPAASQPG